MRRNGHLELEDIIRQTFSLGPEIEVRGIDGPGSLDGWDSLGHIRLIAAVQRSYGLTLSPDDVMKIANVSDLKSLLKSKGAHS